MNDPVDGKTGPEDDPVDVDGPDLPPESVLAGVRPFEWSLEDSVAFEGALDTIGMVIARYSGRIAEERRRAVPNTTTSDLWERARNEASEARRSLRPDDRSEIDRVRQKYDHLYQQLRQTNGPTGA
jgi:hypothetical protein